MQMLKLIIIDDEKIIRENIGARIDWGALGIKLIGLCSNGAEGLDMIMDENPDLVMTDIRMPLFTGLEMIERIRQMNREIEFIILTGYGKFEYAHAAMSLGVKHFLLKPCSKEKIIETVAKAKEDCLSRRGTVVPNEVFRRINLLSAELVCARREPQAILRDVLYLFKNQPGCAYAKSIALSFAAHVWNYYNAFGEVSLFYRMMDGADTVDDVTRILTMNFEQMLARKGEQPVYSGRSFMPCIEKCIEYTKKHYADPSLTLKMIAETHLFMNVDYVSRQFYKVTGEKYSAYLSKLRISKAAQYLRESEDEKIYIVAERVGYGKNPQYFSQIFKKHMGMNPSEYIALIHSGRQSPENNEKAPEIS
ncbi:MAG: response regulator transcription factor [Christensenellales bacterium]|jgi:two-component system response regulator YesN